MKNDSFEAERAELIQSVKALFIPLSLFLACCIMAAGVFLIYNLEPCGWVFVGISATLMVTAFIALIRFQNKLRARGVLVPEEEAIVTQPVCAQAIDLVRAEQKGAEINRTANATASTTASLGSTPTR